MEIKLKVLIILLFLFLVFGSSLSWHRRRRRRRAVRVTPPTITTRRPVSAVPIQLPNATASPVIPTTTTRRPVSAVPIQLPNATASPVIPTTTTRRPFSAVPIQTPNVTASLVIPTTTTLRPFSAVPIQPPNVNSFPVIPTTTISRPISMPNQPANATTSPLIPTTTSRRLVSTVPTRPPKPSTSSVIPTTKTRRPVSVSTRPLKPTVSSVIPKKRCFRILDKIPRYYHVFKKFRPLLCLLLNESQLLQMLKDVGGYNPRYVAINKEATCIFADLSQDLKPLPTNSSRPVRQKRMVSLPPTTIIRGCWSRGSSADGSFLKHLCTECAATTQLPANVFPPYINELICGDADGYCYRRKGRCIQKVIKFTFLKSTGMFEQNAELSAVLGIDVFVEKFETFEQDIRSCCECGAFPFAFLG